MEAVECNGGWRQRADEGRGAKERCCCLALYLHLEAKHVPATQPLHRNHRIAPALASSAASLASACPPLLRWRNSQTNRPSFNILLFVPATRYTPTVVMSAHPIPPSPLEPIPPLSYFVISRDAASDRSSMLARPIDFAAAHTIVPDRPLLFLRAPWGAAPRNSNARPSNLPILSDQARFFALSRCYRVL